MTQLLNSAFEKVTELSELEQNVFARFILDEIENETKWNHSFANSENVLSSIANETLEEFKADKTEILDTGKL
jgi:UDP-N-acetyl-D-mannosaminuronic acid transferase (WecB/TagA/CpsF family)